VSGEKYIRRKRDTSGDKYQVETFREYSNKINFKNFIFRGSLVVRLNPHSGDIEFIKFVPGKTPRTWQANKYIRDDLARFTFSFPRRSVVVREFVVRYEWRILRDPDLTDETARERAVEYLKSQIK